MQIKRRYYLAFFLSLLLPPIIVTGAMVIPGLFEVASTGMCPAAPTDIPPYPCTVWEYLQRMIFGFWALMGIVTIAVGWAIFDILLWLTGWGSYRFYRFLRQRP